MTAFLAFAHGPGVASPDVAIGLVRIGIVPGSPPAWDVPGPTLRTSGARPGDHVWVPSDPDAVREARAGGARPWVVVSTVGEVRTAAELGADLWLRGLEAGGGDATALVLVRAAAATGRPWVAEGLGPRASAAALAVGAAGISIDAPLWLTRRSSLDEAARALVRAARSAHDTAIVGELDGGRRRVLVRGASSIAAPQNVAEAGPHDGADAVDVALGVLRDVSARLDRVRGAAPPGDPLGTGRAVVCGPMANVAEGTGLARAVRAAGALPVAALGALDPAQAQAVLVAWVRDVPRPFGVGVIGFDVMPHRDAHLRAVVEQVGAGTPVVLAGGNVPLARTLAAQGLVPWLHTPSGATAEAALAGGVPGVILEGHEAGGHVGKATSAGLWEEGLAAVERAGAGGVLVALAGGVGDRVSGAFARAMAADAAAGGARIVVQAGTAFLLTHEAADAGQVTPVYQAQALRARTTVLVGSSVNLPLRCVPNAFTDEARALEARWAAEDVPRAERRARLEHHNLGRTRIAAKGVERGDPPGPRYRAVPAARQVDEGAFTVGQGAAVTAGVRRAAEVVADLAGEVPAPSRWGAVSRVHSAAPRRIVHLRASDRVGDVAVIGLGCVLPGALDVPTFFRNLVHGVDAVGPVPEARWRAHRYHDPGAATGPAARTYARHAGVVHGFRFDPLPFRIPPKVVPSLDPSQRMALVAAAEAVRSANLGGRGRFDPRRAAVVLGNAMGGEFAKSAAVRVRFREVLDAVAEDDTFGGRTVEDLAELEARVEARIAPRLPPVDVDSMAGMLSNVVAGRVAAWLDWMGGNLTVDAACAASLAAVSVAVDWLRLGRCDVVLAGGVDTDLAPETFVGFCRTHALSPTGSSPFSAHADGFVMGEGAAVLALKRLEDAHRDGDAVWAVIRGVGTSSDGRGRGITAPRAEGQALAIDRAYADAGLEPDAIGLVEAHGTGTALGDATEVGVLARHFAGRAAPVWLGSVKSNIGHLKSAAGAASLVKAVLALRTGVVPPTLHAGPVHPELGLERTPFRLPRRPVPLPEDRPRASVSAFGFGGTNYHVVLEAPTTPRPAPAAAMRVQAAPHVVPAEIGAWAADDATPVLLAYGAASEGALHDAVRADRPGAPADVARCAHRLVVLAEPGADGRTAAVARAVEALSGRAGPRVWAGSGPAVPVVLAFPGQGAQRRGGFDAATSTPAGAVAASAIAARLAERRPDLRPLRELERRGDGASDDPLDVHLGLYTIGAAWRALLDAAEIPVAAVVGHSLGGLTALAAADAAPAEALLAAVIARGEALAACPPGAMAAVHAAPGEARGWGAARGLSLAAVNGPERAVLSGDPAAIDALVAELGPARARKLDVARAYHSPAVAPAAAAVRAALGALGAPKIPVWSARTGAAAPADGAALAEDAAEAVVAPVRFYDVACALVAAGHRLWIEAGPGTTLSRIAEAAGAQAIPLDPGPRGGLAAAAAALLAAGHAGLAERLPGTVLAKALPAPPPAPPPPTRAGRVASPPAPERSAAAARVVDLRIAALADPSVAPVYEAARAALIRALADADAAGASPAAAEARPTQVPSPAPPVAPIASMAPVAPAPVAPAPVAPAPAPVAPAPVAAEGDAIRAAVVAVICEVTGYPPELVAQGADLEADLGVDSIRKMEILGTLEKRLGFTSADADYAALSGADLDTIVSHVRRRLDRPVEAPALAPPPPQEAAVAVFVRRRLDDAPERATSPVQPLWIAPGTAPADVVARLAGAALPDPVAAVLPDDAGGAAAAGWLRAAARELGRPLRLVHTVGVVARERVLAELGSVRPAETWLDAAGAWSEAALPVAPAPAVAWPERPAIVATGGAHGILAACLLGLADLAPRVVLLARSPAEAAAPGLAPLQAAGVEVVYRTGDVTRAEDVHAAVAEARARWGRVDAVVHAAGVLRDAPLGRLSPDDAHAVLAPKWDGAGNLLAATAGDPLTWFCTFSSIVARVGNPGQAAYAAANAAMETIVHPTARTTHIRWTAWSDVGMAADPRLLALLGSRGVRAVPPAAGAAAFRALAAGAGSGPVLVTAAGAAPFDVETLRWPLGPPDRLDVPPLSFAVPLDPASAPLADHRVAGRPLVPAALWLAAMIEAARAASGRDGPWAVEGMAIHGPVFVDRPRADVRLRLEPDPLGGAAWRAVVEADGAPVCRARVVASAPPVPNGGPPPPLVDPEPAAPLYRPDLLFHGPAWQILRSVVTDAHGAQADLHGGPALAGGPTAVAAVVDGAHQVLAAWGGRSAGWLGLPVGADRWVADGAFDGVVRIETRVSPGPHELTAEVVALDADGRVVMRGEGVRLRAARAREAPDA